MRRIVVTGALIGALGLAAPSAMGHGGTTVANGQRDGVTVLVQGSELTLPDGTAAADLATTLAGPGTGEGSRVTYYLRPEGRSSTVTIRTERDAGGVHHAEIPTSGRGDWRKWDVSAVVRLTTGKQVRVTNDEQNPPAPAPAREPEPATTAEPTTPSASAAPAATEQTAAVDDISGESDGPPGWMLPSLAGLVLIGGVILAATRRRRGSDEPDSGDWS